jgi:hypothetical protein
MTDIETAAQKLYLAALRLRPSDPAMRGLPDHQQVTLGTTIGALRQFVATLREVEPVIRATMPPPIDAGAT